MTDQPDTIRPQDPASESDQAAAAPQQADVPPGPMLPARLNVLAVISLASSFVVGLVGVVCGIVSLQQIKRSRERGSGLAIAGIVVGSVQTAAVTMLVIVAMIGAAALGVAHSVSRSIDSAPEGSNDIGITEECADVLGVIRAAEANLSDPTVFAGDPQAALAALTSFSDELKSAGAGISDPDVASAAQDAVDELDSLVAYLSQIVADPGSVGPDTQSRSLEHIRDLSESFGDLQAACSPQN